MAGGAGLFAVASGVGMVGSGFQALGGDPRGFMSEIASSQFAKAYPFDPMINDWVTSEITRLLADIFPDPISPYCGF